MATKPPTLTDTLTDLLVRARRAPGFPARATVGAGKPDGGLRLDIKILIYATGETETFLQLSRTGPYPAETEWTTVINHWPEKLAVHPAFRRFKGQDKRRYLSGSFVTKKSPEQAELFQE